MKMFSIRLNPSRTVDLMIIQYLQAIPAQQRTSAVKQLLARQLAPKAPLMPMPKVTPLPRKAWKLPKRLNSTFALQVLQSLSQREVRVIEAVARHPFLSCCDLLALFNTASFPPMARGLRFLRQVHALAHLTPKSAKSKPSQYYYTLDKVGAMILGWRWHEQPRRLNHLVGLTARQIGYLDHTIEINRFFLNLLATSRQQGGHALEVWKSETRSLTRFRGRRGRSILRPDAQGLYRVQNERCSFYLEWDRGNSVMEKYRAKFERYAQYYDDARRNPDKFVNGVPALWIVTTTTQREEFILETLQRLSWEYAIDMPALLTTNPLLSRGPLEPIWRSLDDEQGRKCFYGG